jgi:hypothetical protein
MCTSQLVIFHRIRRLFRGTRRISMVKPSFFSRSQQNRLVSGLERNMIFLIGLARIDDSAQDFEQFVGDVVHNDDSR